MSVIRKRGSAYSNYKNEGRVARLCIAIFADCGGGVSYGYLLNPQHKGRIAGGV